MRRKRKEWKGKGSRGMMLSLLEQIDSADVLCTKAVKFLLLNYLQNRKTYEEMYSVHSVCSVFETVPARIIQREDSALQIIRTESNSE